MCTYQALITRGAPVIHHKVAVVFELERTREAVNCLVEAVSRAQHVSAMDIHVCHIRRVLQRTNKKKLNHN